jgi:glycosyltransferase involved in cell wall biosynthesis
VSSNSNLKHALVRTVVVIVNQAWVAWKFRTRLIAHLRAEGWRVVLVTDTRENGELLAGHCDDLVHVPVAARQINPWSDLVTFFGYWRALRAARPDVVLTFTIKPNIYGSLACRVLGIPTISNVTGLGTIQRSGALITATVRWLYRLAFARSSWIFFQNRADATQMETAGLVPVGGWSILPGSGVDTDYYRPKARPAGATQFRFCMMARLLLEKGVVEYAEAARRVRARRPDLRFDLWGILDDHDARYVTREQISAWEEGGVLAYHGEARDAVQAFAEADVVVLPSYYAEGVPRTLLEASSLGLPCITTDMPGCRDAVEHGRTGLHCQARNIDDLAAAMLEMVERGLPAMCVMGEAGRRRMLEQFDEGIVLNQYSRQIATTQQMAVDSAAAMARVDE